MCEDHSFEKDRQEFERLGLVTRRQFGIMLGAGMAMMLPRVPNAATVTESEVTITTPDGTADCYFVHPASGTAPGVLMWPDIFGLRPAFRTMGKRLAGLLGDAKKSVRASGVGFPERKNWHQSGLASRKFHKSF